jgi:hypothetical protein
MYSIDDPPRKRSKVEEEANGAAPPSTTDGRCELPPEVWGNILDYLPFSDVLRTSIVSKYMLHDALPQVTRLSIFKVGELRSAYARRFQTGNVNQIDVYCLITCLDPDDDEEKFSICQNTASAIVPFLCHFTSNKLRSVGLDVDAQGIPLGTYFRDTFLQEDSVEIVRSLVRSICGAYHTGAFSQNVKIYGPAFQAGTFICYKAHGCNLCQLYCESFPLEQAVNARATCLSVKERLKVIADRPGGSECLASKTVVLELLSSNYQVPFTLEVGADGSSITEQAIVFSKAVMEELELLCRDYFAAANSSLTPEEVLEALVGSPDEAEDECWLVKRYYDKLTSLGIPVKESDVLVVEESKLLSDVHDHI